MRRASSMNNSLHCFDGAKETAISSQAQVPVKDGFVHSEEYQAEGIRTYKSCTVEGRETLYG